jgi:hypothetical protein
MHYRYKSGGTDRSWVSQNYKDVTPLVSKTDKYRRKIYPCACQKTSELYLCMKLACCLRIRSEFKNIGYQLDNRRLDNSLFYYTYYKNRFCTNIAQEIMYLFYGCTNFRSREFSFRWRTGEISQIRNYEFEYFGNYCELRRVKNHTCSNICCIAELSHICYSLYKCSRNIQKFNKPLNKVALKIKWKWL